MEHSQPTDLGKAPTSYWEELHDFIADPSNGLLLDAETYFDENGVRESQPGSAFYLTSGKYRRYFITLWELYDHPGVFDRCVSMLADKAISLSRDHLFDTIVTCTHTARELLYHVRPLVEEALGKQLIVSEFGHYPWTSSADIEAQDFRSRTVLIFTDVMASGSLVRDMAARVIHSGGDVVAVLCVVRTDVFLNTGGHSVQGLSFDLGHGLLSRPAHVPVYALTSYYIPELEAGEFHTDRIRRIDFESVSPELSPPEGHSLDPIMTPDQMFEDFRRSDALAFGFYYGDKRWSSLAVRVRRLLALAGDGIWEKIKNLIPEDAILISTYKKDDLHFSQFVQNRLNNDGHNPQVVVLKRERRDSPRLHRALLGNAPALRGRHVMLLRYSANTSEELRALAALFAGEHVASIRVLCLVNRMGPFTISFVNRIQKLIAGALAPEEERGAALFEFLSIYDLQDLRMDDLERMHNRIRGVWSNFKQSTRVEHFKYLAETSGRAFTPRSLNTFSFETGTEQIAVTPVRGAFAAEGNQPALAQRMAAIVDEIIHSRSRKRLIDCVADVRRPDAFLYLAGLAVADIDYLRLSGLLPWIINAFRSRLAEIRSERFQLEDADIKPERGSQGDRDLKAAIAYCIHLETHILTAWGLLAHFDKPSHNEVAMLGEVLFADKGSQFWHAHPINLDSHFREIRNHGLFAFLLHGTAPNLLYDRAEDDLRIRIAGELETRFEGLLRGFTDSSNLGVEHDVVLWGNIRELKDLLLAEFRVHTHGGWHERIDYLQTYVLRDSGQHSALFTPLIAAERDFRAYISRQKSHRRHPARSLTTNTVQDPDSSDSVLNGRISSRVQEALTAVLTLREVTEIAHELSHYPSRIIATLLRPRFSKHDEQRSFMHTVNLLTDWLSNLEAGVPKDEVELNTFEALVQDVQETVFEPKCALRRALSYFVVPLKSALIEALEEANERLKLLLYHNVWDHEIDLLSKGSTDHASEEAVLIDPLFLREILRNTLFNVRHNFQLSDNRSFSDRVCISFESRSEPSNFSKSEIQQYVVMRVEADGVPVRLAAQESMAHLSTLDDHQARLREFGGTLSLGSRPGGTGSLVELKLLSRKAYFRRGHEQRPLSISLE